MRVARAVRPQRAARASSGAGDSASASNTPSSLAANRAFAAMNPVAISKIGAGSVEAADVSLAMVMMPPGGLGSGAASRSQANPTIPGIWEAALAPPEFWDAPLCRCAYTIQVSDAGIRRATEQLAKVAEKGDAWVTFVEAA